MNGNLLTFATVGALGAVGVARRDKRAASPAGSRALSSRTVRFDDLPHDFRCLFEDLVEERWGSDDGEPALPPAVLPVTLQPVEPLYRQVEHDAWDDRGPEHVADMVRTMGQRVPRIKTYVPGLRVYVPGIRDDPEAVANQLLEIVAGKEWVRGAQVPRNRVWMAPVVTMGGVVADGRHRLFAAHQLGITHLPAIEVDDLGPAGSRAATGVILGDLPLYHGTRHDFTVFQFGHPGRKDNGWLGRGVYLTDSPDLAESYARIKRGPASPRVMEVRAILQNPYVVDDQKDPDLKKKISEKGERATLAMTAELRRLGHDGVILRLPEGGGAREIVVLDPGRIRHVRTRVLPPIRKRGGSPDRRVPRKGDHVRADDYAWAGLHGHQPWLYHVAPRAQLANIQKNGLRPGTGARWGCSSAREHSRDRVFFSTQPDRWYGCTQVDDPVLLRVPTGAVDCRYDGMEWLYDEGYEGTDREGEIVEGRLSDCFTTRPVPAHLVEVVEGPVVQALARKWGSASADPRDLGRRLRAAVTEDAAFRILDADPDLVGSDWGQGGCAVLAAALAQILGPEAQLHAMVHDGHVQHYVVVHAGRILDGDGGATLATFRRRWLRDYGALWARTGRDARDCRLVRVPAVRDAVDARGQVVTFDGACPPRVVAALVAHLHPRLLT